MLVVLAISQFKEFVKIIYREVDMYMINGCARTLLRIYFN